MDPKAIRKQAWKEFLTNGEQIQLGKDPIGLLAWWSPGWGWG